MSAAARLSSLFSVVYVTVPTLEVGKKIAREVVEKKLAACVNVVPQITSIYAWNGKIEEDNELLLIIKTHTSAIEALKRHVTSAHPYDVPEFIALPIEHGSEPYLNWIREQITGAETPTPNITAPSESDKRNDL